MKQSEHFINGEGEAWLKRNKAKLPVKNDPVIEALKQHPEIQPGGIVEVGAANGWRLSILREHYNCSAEGIDPGASLTEWSKSGVYRGTADNLRFPDNDFDLVIYGFCLYLCDREDLFKIVAEGDRVLKDGGYLMIYDFAAAPHSKEYHHKPGILSYKMDYAHLWLGNPAYTLVARHYFPEATSVAILKKDIANAWPLRK